MTKPESKEGWETAEILIDGLELCIANPKASHNPLMLQVNGKWCYVKEFKAHKDRNEVLYDPPPNDKHK